MSVKSRIEKLEVGAANTAHSFITWDKSRLTAEEAAFIETDENGRDTQVFSAIAGTKEYALAESILEKHSDIIDLGGDAIHLIVYEIINPSEPTQPKFKGQIVV